METATERPTEEQQEENLLNIFNTPPTPEPTGDKHDGSVVVAQTEVEEGAEKPGGEKPEAKEEEKPDDKKDKAKGEKKDGEEEQKPEFKVDDLLAKNEKGEELTEEEIKFLKDNDYDVAPEKPEEEEKPEGKPFELPESLSKYFEGKEIKTQEAYNQAVEEAIAERDNQIEKDQETYKSLTTKFQENPEFLELTKNIMKGMPLKAALIATGINADDLSSDPADEDYESVVDARVQAKINAQKKEQEAQAIAKNREQSEQEITQWKKELKISDEQADKTISELHGIFSDLMEGKISKTTLTKLHKGLNYESDIQKEVKKAEVKAMNAKYKIEKRKRQGDGLPNLNGSGGARKEKPQADPFLSMLDDALKDEKRQRR